MWLLFQDSILKFRNWLLWTGQKTYWKLVGLLVFQSCTFTSLPLFLAERWRCFLPRTDSSRSSQLNGREKRSEASFMLWPSVFTLPQATSHEIITCCHNMCAQCISLEFCLNARSFLSFQEASAKANQEQQRLFLNRNLKLPLRAQIILV